MGSSSATPSAESVRRQLDKITASEGLASARSLARFLSFVVEKTLEGDGTAIKEYLIGVDVFERGDDFDPRIDPIVRVQAGKLRTRLKQYYEHEGANDAVIIEFPKGGYVPVFRVREVAKPSAAGSLRSISPARNRMALLSFAAIGLVATVGGAWWSVARARHNTSNVTLTRLTSDSGQTTHPAVSTDGKLLAYSSDRGPGGDSNIWIQSIQGGEPVRLTSHPAADTSPDFSPDGTHVVFRSWRDGGGIYLAPVLGGQERRIADGGYSPRFSPDGKWVAFAANGIRVVSPTGGESRLVSGALVGATCPVWTPDGKNLLLLGAEAGGSLDWWVASMDQHKNPSATGVAADFHQRGLPPLDENTCPSDWLGNEVVFSFKVEGMGNLWKVPLSARSWTIAGAPRQVVPGPAVDHPRVLRQPGVPPRLIFATDNRMRHIWSLPLPANQVHAGGEMTQLTRDASLLPGLNGTRPAFSGDGSKLIFASARAGNLDIWMKDLTTGREESLTRDSRPEDRPLVDKAGKILVYRLSEGTRRSIYMMEIGRGTPQKVCDDCGEPKDLSANGDLLLLQNGQPWGLYLLSMRTGRTTELLKDAKNLLMEASFSPDMHWIAVALGNTTEYRHRGYVVAFNGEKLGERGSWIPIIDEMYHLQMRWSPDGNVLYYFAVKDDSRCLWAQRLDPRTKQPAGEPVALRHFHKVQQYPLSGSWVAVAEDKIAFNLSDTISNIWMAALP
jgi:Tol biopolymer transport system component